MSSSNSSNISNIRTVLYYSIQTADEKSPVTKGYRQCSAIFIDPQNSAAMIYPSRTVFAIGVLPLNPSLVDR